MNRSVILLINYHEKNTDKIFHFFKPGGGQVKIESKKLEWNATARTPNLNTAYVPGGGDKRVRLSL
jgi:hypothetical protein